MKYPLHNLLVLVCNYTLYTVVIYVDMHIYKGEKMTRLLSFTTLSNHALLM